MRNVVRGTKPKTLQRNATRWKNELLAEIRRCKGTDEKVEKKYSNRYRTKAIREALQKMYGDRCCYCEAPIKVVAFDHIEHRKPKDKNKFPESTFVWSNLHLACPKCNNAKGNKWNKHHQILDAVIDVPISEHLGYLESTTGLRRQPRTDRGDTTITHAELDRSGLPEARRDVYMETLKTIREIRKARQRNVDLPKVAASTRELQDKTMGDYGSVIAWALNEFLSDDAGT